MKEILIAEQMAINITDWPLLIIVLVIGIIIGKKINTLTGRNINHIMS